MRTILLFSGLYLILVLSSCSRSNPDTKQTQTDSTTVAMISEAKDDYTCPMHPSVHSDKPGACPICGMTLVKRLVQRTTSESDLQSIRAVSLSPTQRVIANVSTEPVKRQTLKKEITAVGVVDFAEPNQAKVSARFRGRIEKLYVSFTGEVVRKGQPLFDLYSPDLISAEQELILAVKAYNGSASNDMASDQQRMLQAARERLRIHFGMTNEQIVEIEQTKQLKSTMTFNSPISGTVIAKEVQEGQYVEEGMLLYQLVDLSRFWIYVEVYEKDIRFIKLGQSVGITTEAYPDELFKGQVTFIDPVINTDSRTIRIRTEFVNSAGKLKPQMYVKAVIQMVKGDALVIPASAVLSTGKRNVVWVEVKPNTFEPRVVTLGVHTDSQCEIMEGLNEGDVIVVTGGFIIDSESQLQQPSGALDEPRSNAIAHSEHKPVSAPEVQEIKITVDGAYTPEIVHVQKGKPVRMKFYREDNSECTKEVVFKSLNIRKALPSKKTTVIEFTPKQSGEIVFVCGEDMVRGKVVVK
ncbi:MAG: efflux RND transporter periplasmic adaptor subunit [Ignavibacteria bacterium]|nr:efflux RND transporter periplasmic adaptor subunit [Ignavibacteria bacterium]